MSDELAPAPLPEIAPVEVLLATIGLKPIISRAVETISSEKLAEMAGMPDEIRRLAKQLVRSESVSVPAYPDFDYRGAVKELAKGWDVQQVIAMIKKFPSQYAATGTALVVKAEATIKQLLQGYPVAQYQTLTGSVNLLPSDMKLFKFVTVLEAIDEPLNVFKFMSSGSLLKSQAHAVRTVYPTLSAAIDAAIMNETIAAKAANKAFELNPRAEYGVKNWFGKPQVGTATFKQAQLNHAVSNQRKAQKKAPAEQNSKASGNMLTSSQRAEAKAPPTT